MTEEQLDLLETYFRLMTWNGISRLYRTARETGILDAVAKGTDSAAVIAERCGTLPEPTSLVVEALCEAGVAARDGESYGLGLVMAMLQGNYRDLGDSYWDHLPSFLRTGEPLMGLQNPLETQEFYPDRGGELGVMMRPSAELVTGALSIGADRKGLSILDVGAGSGVWSLTMAAADPSSRVTCLDLPAVLPVAKHFAAQAGVRERLELLPGDYHEVDTGESRYDLVILGILAISFSVLDNWYNLFVSLVPLAIALIALAMGVAFLVGRSTFAGTELAHPAHLVTLGLIISICGQLGDLALSSVKRGLKIKDFGTLGDCRKIIYKNAPDFRSYSRRASRCIASYVTAGTTQTTHEKTSRLVCDLTEIALIPGHGGLLDRFDSLLIVPTAVFHSVCQIQSPFLDPVTGVITG